MDRIQQNEPCDHHGLAIDFLLPSICCSDGARDSSVSFYPLGLSAENGVGNTGFARRVSATTSDTTLGRFLGFQAMAGTVATFAVHSTYVQNAAKVCAQGRADLGDTCQSVIALGNVWFWMVSRPG